MPFVPPLHIIYASTSGHTEYVVKTILDALADKATVTVQRVEQTTLEDLTKDGVLLLASGTWNTGSVEGQLNPHMHAFLMEKAAATDLKGRKVLVVGLGDERYRYTCKAADRLEKFINDHKGMLLAPTLRIINEPYGQEEKVKSWVKEISPHLA